jgi:hypothetical protein
MFIEFSHVRCQVFSPTAISQVGSEEPAIRPSSSLAAGSSPGRFCRPSNKLEEKTMKKAVRFIVVMVALMAFASATVAMAATEFYVAKDAQGKVSILDTKPADAKSIVKGPFATKAEAEKAMKDTETAKPAVPPLGK